MELKWRLESREALYDTLVKWWNDWGFPVLPYKSLPATIFVVYNEQEDLYAVPMYLSNSDMCWLGFPTSNKQAAKESKEGALQFLLDKIATCLKYQGYDRIITTSFNPKLMGIFEECGYILSDEKTNYFTKEL